MDESDEKRVAALRTLETWTSKLLSVMLSQFFIQNGQIIILFFQKSSEFNATIS